MARKNTALTIRHSKISRQHIVFEVGECSEEDVVRGSVLSVHHGSLTIRPAAGEPKLHPKVDGSESE